MILALWLLAAPAAEPAPLRAERRPVVAEIPGPPGTRAAAVHRAASGEVILVVAEPDGALRRLVGPAGWRPGGRVDAGPGVADVAVDDRGDVWLLGPGGLRAWRDGALHVVPCDGCRDLRPDAALPVGAPTGVVPLADGLVAVTDTPDPSAPALVQVEGGWARVEGDQRGLARPAPEAQVSGLRGAGGHTLWTLRADRVEHDGTERVLPDFLPGDEVVARLVRDPEGGAVALAWDPRRLRIWTLGLDVPSALRFDQHWLPGGASASWPRAAATGDAGPVVSVLDVPLPPGLAITDVTVAAEHVVIIGASPGEPQAVPVVLTVPRIPRP